MLLVFSCMRAIFKAIPVAALVLLQTAAHAHNEYRSFSQLDWNDADGSIELVMQIHSHELETKLSLLLDERLSFLEDDDFEKLQTATHHYIFNNITLELDGKPVTLLFLGMESDGQNATAYLEADWSEEPRTIKFMNSMFLEDLPGQINSVLGTVMGVRKGGDITATSGPVRFDF